MSKLTLSLLIILLTLTIPANSVMPQNNNTLDMTSTLRYMKNFSYVLGGMGILIGSIGLAQKFGWIQQQNPAQPTAQPKPTAPAIPGIADLPETAQTSTPSLSSSPEKLIGVGLLCVVLAPIWYGFTHVAQQSANSPHGFLYNFGRPTRLN